MTSLTSGGRYSSLADSGHGVFFLVFSDIVEDSRFEKLLIHVWQFELNILGISHASVKDCSMIIGRGA
jgi:hypothetical protein